ncbi:Uncharacterized protein APZ42_029845 [Daphnia magna]|uniref:Uncharacterized protein n=1 Tax=Daphnia magna TaxID=35525 RepID=A0A164P9R2_9CRUS|nr:Uncharacterized protein APZ42_029845 [Daphnia magna]
MCGDVPVACSRRDSKPFFFFSCFIYSFFSPFSFSTAKRSTLRPFLTLIFFLYFLFTRFEKLGSVKKTKRGKKKRIFIISPS